MAGTWGKICINKGKLLYTIEVEPIESIELSPAKYGVVEPEIPDHIKRIFKRFWWTPHLSIPSFYNHFN